VAYVGIVLGLRVNEATTLVRMAKARLPI